MQVARFRARSFLFDSVVAWAVCFVGCPAGVAQQKSKQGHKTFMHLSHAWLSGILLSFFSRVVGRSLTTAQRSRSLSISNRVKWDRTA